MSNKIDTDNFWNAFHESVGPSTSEALDNDTKKLGIPAVRFITEDWKSLIEEIRQEALNERSFIYRGDIYLGIDQLVEHVKKESTGELCSIIEDMAGMFVMLSPQESTRPNVKRAEAAYRKYLAITTKSA